MMHATDIALLLGFCVLTAVSVVLFRLGYNQIGVEFKPEFLLKWILNPYVFLSLATATGCRFLFYALFKSYSTSVVYLITTLSYVFVLAACYIAFGDKLSLPQWIGAVLIIIGVALVGG